LKFGFQFETYHTQWNRSALERMVGSGSGAPNDLSGIYRSRQNVQPEVTLVLAKPLTLTAGVSLQRFETQFPAAHTEAANALITTLRYHRRLEGEGVQQELDAGYSLRAATTLLGSDFAFVRHKWRMAYTFSSGKHKLLDDAMAGVMGGEAPLSERFVLGNNSTLRGWNKWDIDPLGGSRVVHNSLEYRYWYFQVFYDTGAVWDRNQPATIRHSVGVGLRQGSFSLAVAVPVRDGKLEPIFMVGMNY
jgi:hemolysin activation/secretion protein